MKIRFQFFSKKFYLNKNLNSYKPEDCFKIVSNFSSCFLFRPGFTSYKQQNKIISKNVTMNQQNKYEKLLLYR